MRVLVTGSHGFVGRWLTSHLQDEGDEVIGLDAEVDVTRAGELKDAVTAGEPDAVIHLAAQASVGSSWGQSEQTYLVNTVGTANLLDAALACRNRPRVILVSSSEVYGRVSTLPIAEDAPMAPVSPYAASKASAEMAGIQAWLGSALEVVRVRPFNHTGPGQRPDFVVPALAQQVAAAAAAGTERLATGNLEARRDISDVRDVVRSYRLLVEKGEPGRVYNVCSGQAVSIADIAERLIRIAGVDLPVVVDPARVRPVEIPELRGDRTRLTEATGWEPAIPLDRTLADVLSWWATRVA